MKHILYVLLLTIWWLMLLIYSVLDAIWRFRLDMMRDVTDDYVRRINSRWKHVTKKRRRIQTF